VREGGVTETLRADVIVVGSGAGGAPAAASLAEAGLDVLLLEAGPRVETRDFTGEPREMLARLMTAVTSAESGLEIYAGRCVGGSTVVNDALCWRPPSEILADWRTRFGLDGWTDAALAPYVERAWRAVNASPTDGAQLSRNAHLLALGAERLGWAAEAMPRSVRGCANLGLCNLGCPTGAKQSSLVSWVPMAERAGARVLAPVRVERILRRGDAASGVVATRFGPDGAPGGELIAEAPAICLAGGVLGTPPLLLRSGLEGPGVPAGRGVQLHSSVHVTARFAEPVHGYYGPTMSYAVSEFSDVNGHAGPGFMIENVTVDPVTTASSLPGTGAAHAERMSALPYLARSLVVLRDATRGEIDLESSGDARVRYLPMPADLARLRDGMAAIARAYLAAGASEVWLPLHGSAPIRRESDLAAIGTGDVSPRTLTLLYAVHLFGGAGMGADPARGTCDGDGRVFGTRGLWVSDASALPGNTGVNPQITIMAHALRVADAIRAESRRSA
jgi:choline dehydrogenase-like flavoprotein